MNMNLVNEITASQIRTDIPQFSSGDTVKVHVKITEGDKSRIQIYEGVVMSTRGSGVSKTFTVRKISAGQIGVERTLPMNSPKIDTVTVISRGKVRRAKLNYLRTLKSQPKIKERRSN